MKSRQPSHNPQVVHRLLHASKLFAGMPQEIRDELSSQFSTHTFTPGDVIIRAGDTGRSLGVILEGQAAVVARKEDQVFRVATLPIGSLFGEVNFFDAQSQRTADIVGVTDGVAALLPSQIYERFAADGHAAAELLEKNVLHILAGRIQGTNNTLAELLQRRGGGLLAGLARFFRGDR